jgi:hypothetical protein
MIDLHTDYFNEARLQARLSKLSDAELAALEDDLDFCNFTGVPTVRVLDVLKDLTVLDKGWKRMLEKRDQTLLPLPY